MKDRFSKYLNPLLLIIDLLIINGVAFYFLKNQKINLYFFGFITLFWIVSSVSTKFYKVYRYTGVLKLLRLLTVQLIVFFIGYFAFFGIFKEGVIINRQFDTIIYITFLVFILKLIVFFALKAYRKYGKNYRKVLFVGIDDTGLKLLKLFSKKKDLGYLTLGFFSNINSNHKKYLGNIKQIYNFIENNYVDEIYASKTELKKSQLKELNKLSSKKNINLKLIPNSVELYSKSQKTEYYNDTFKILKIKKLPFEHIENKVIKRIFDIIFSFFVIIFLMSWLVPILWILIKIESKGPLFFKQEREGLNGKNFVCYKFRSMRKNDLADKIHATKNDFRVTKIGKFIRKTSIDELPQFYNVFLGDMSVVGPRPHMENLANEYQKDVDNYIERHAVKPGITGLAQISGYRGEIKKKSDIKNRVRLDIFYIENWSFFLDLKIIIKTVLNIFQGEENAY